MINQVKHNDIVRIFLDLALDCIDNTHDGIVYCSLCCRVFIKLLEMEMVSKSDLSSFLEKVAQCKWQESNRSGTRSLMESITITMGEQEILVFEEVLNPYLRDDNLQHLLGQLM
jgi:hypothetical protein